MIENPNPRSFYSPQEMVDRQNYIPKMKSDLLDKLNDLKNKIESFYKNNIDWNKVRSIGELDYSQNMIRDFKKYNEKQKEAV